jgi:PKD repeat protein
VHDDSTGCVNVADHIVHVHGLPVAEFPTIPEQCVGEELTVFSSSIAVESYAWMFADTLVSNSSDATVIFGEEGSLNLSLTVVNEWGCIDSVQQAVQWIAPPVAEFTLTEDSGCVPFSIGIESSATGQMDLVQWSIDGAALVLESGDSILIEDPSSVGGNILQMMVSNSCGVDSMQDTLAVLDVPSIQILETIDGGCSPFLAEFAFEAEGTLDVLTWNFGNGEETNGFFPLWPVFEAESEPVEYFAILTASNVCGSAMDSTSVVVEPALAQAQFDLDVASGCLPLSITATDMSAGGDMVLLTFGDGTIASDSVAVHTYTEPGTYVITQTVSGACSVDSFEMDVTVHPAFELEFAPTTENACVGDSVWLDVLPSAPASSIQIEWTTPLGVELFAVPANIAMTTAGLQTISATATDSIHGCSAQSNFEVFVHSPLVIEIDSNSQITCSPLMVTLQNQTEGDGQWSWSVDEESPFSNAFSPELLLTNEGDVPLEHWIQVAVVSEWGCSSMDSVHVEVLPSPAGTFELLDSIACGVPSLITPQVESSESSQLAWFIDSVLVSTESNVELEFLSPGNHVITLMSENEFGCHGFAQDSVEILVLPQVSLAAGPLMGCAPHLLEVEHSSIDAIEWLFEIHLDSTLVFESDSETSEVMLEIPGSYGVSFTAVSDRGCVASISLEDSVVVLPRPAVGFYADPYAGTFDAPDPLNSSWVFENVSDVGQAIWDFGDGELSSEWHGTHAYDASGTFEVLLTVINDFGCASEFMMIVEVLESLEVYVPNAFTPPEQGYADGINDGWKPILSDPNLVDRYELVVYNRYGQLVWETQDPSSHWIGEARVGGSYFAPGGIYTWVLQIDSQAFSESSRQWKGQVNLLR